MEHSLSLPASSQVKHSAALYLPPAGGAVGQDQTSRLECMYSHQLLYHYLPRVHPGRPVPLTDHPPCSKRQRRYQPKPSPGVSVFPAIDPPDILCQTNHDAAPYLAPVDEAVETEANMLPPLPAGPILSKPSRSLLSEVIIYTAPHTFNAC